ncbi:MAG: hypothetical protein AUJ98_07545 [Bacteroidetes bacterium CG2_30_33_31]|nr:MAG: hypothetical protein AUJ98_07545 [Bacteroidetes bacterium CG2_30_33_31]
MNIIKLSIAALGIVSIAGCAHDTKNNKMETGKTIEKAIDLANMDSTINPGNDFFKYANGGWMSKNQIPEEFSRYGAFEVLDKLNKERIKSIILEVSKIKNAKIGSPTQQIGDFYKAAMDTLAINKLGFQPIKALLESIDQMKDKKEIPTMQANLNFKGTYPIFALYSAQDEKKSDRIIANIAQGGLSLPDRDYYTSNDPRSIEIRKFYSSYLIDMLKLTGYDDATAKKLSLVIMKMETRLAKASMTRLEQRDPKNVYHLLTLDKLQKLAPTYNFSDYLNALGITNIADLNVNQPKFIKEIGLMMKDISLDEWKLYLKWNVINSNADLLSSDFQELKFDFFGKKFSGTQKMQERWKRVVSAVNGNLGEAMGKLYVDKYFPKEAKERMIKLVSNLKISLGESIKNLDWMSDVTKGKAIEKLNKINVKVGYPNKWIDYSSIKISANNYVQNSWNCAEFEYKYNLNKIGKPVDRDEWGMTPQTVNAYYSPNMNEIVFPAAILQPPFFDMNADDAVNYGAIGVVIGHEMTHGFDDQGRLYDLNGNLTDWWTKEDADKFKAKTQIIVNQYNNYSFGDSLNINGNLTLGENIADNGGLFIAHAALLNSYKSNGTPKNIDNLNFDQRFLISYAQVWRQNIRHEELMRRLKEDVHSPGEARVNAGVANLPWWYEAFNIKHGDMFYIAPENRAKIW